MTTAPLSPMRPSDAFTWHMERDPSLRSTVVAVIWLDQAPDWEQFKARVDRMARTVPGMRQRVVESPLPFVTPRWVTDPHFDLEFHLRHVSAPPPGDREAVLEVARESAMDAFDRDRPLWEMTVVEQMTGGAAALVVKMHHSLTDGVGSMRTLTVLFDLERAGSDLGAMPPEPTGDTVGLRARAQEAVESLARSGWQATRRTAESALPIMGHVVSNPFRAAGETVELARSVYRTAGPMLDTRSPVMRERAMTRHLAMLEVPLADLKAAAAVVGGTVNDAFLGAVTGGLRRYHHLHGHPVEELRVTMPINLRTADDVSWGNKITLQRVTLPVEEENPASRMRLIHQAADHARHEPSLPVTDAIAGALNLLPSSYVGGVLKHIDFLASNVPGSPIPIYLAGAEVTGFYGFGPTIGSALNVTLMSYRGRCEVGVNVDTAAVPDHDVLLRCLREGFAEVVALSAARA